MEEQISSRDIEELANSFTGPYIKKDYMPLEVIIEILYKYNLMYDIFNFRIPKFSGMLHSLEGQYIIVVNQNHHIRKRTFTVAHEIGHYLLHLHLMTEFFCNDMFKATNKKIENEANRFAAEILMPLYVFLNLLKSTKDNFTSIARRLNISEEAVRWRYVDLCNEHANIPRNVLIEKVIKPYKTEQDRRYNMRQFDLI